MRMRRFSLHFFACKRNTSCCFITSFLLGGSIEAAISFKILVTIGILLSTSNGMLQTFVLIIPFLKSFTTLSISSKSMVGGRLGVDVELCHQDVATTEVVTVQSQLATAPTLERTRVGRIGVVVH